MKRFSVDRVEENFAVCECEDLSHILIPTASFDFEVKEGMIIYLQSDGTYVKDEAEEAKMREKIAALQKKLAEKDK